MVFSLTEANENQYLYIFYLHNFNIINFTSGSVELLINFYPENKTRLTEPNLHGLANYLIVRQTMINRHRTVWAIMVETILVTGATGTVSSEVVKGAFIFRSECKSRLFTHKVKLINLTMIKELISLVSITINQSLLPMRLGM